MKRNPFLLRGMIKSNEHFWGRLNETSQIYSLLLDSPEQPQSVVIVGNRKIGKSSLLYRIHSKRDAHPIYQSQIERTVTVMLSMQGLSGCTADQFYTRILEEIDSTDGRAKELLGQIKSRSGGEPEIVLERLLRVLDREETLLVLILDEFESAADNPHFDKTFFDKLRAIAQDRRLAYLVATQHDLDQVWDSNLISSPNSSPFFNFFQTLTLKCFSEDQTREYLVAASERAENRLPEDKIQTAMWVGGNHPFFLNVAATHLFDDSSDRIASNTARARILADPAIFGNFRYYLGRLEPYQLRVLVAVANAKIGREPTPEDSATLTWLERMSLVERSAEGDCRPLSLAFAQYVVQSVRTHSKSKSYVLHVTDDVAELIAQDESAELEFKSSLQWDYQNNKKADYVQMATIKTIAAFLNTNGGTLVIGIADDGSVLGLENDYKLLRKRNRDGLQLQLMDLVAQHIGAGWCRYLRIAFHLSDDKEVCRVLAEPGDEPAFVGPEARFFVRTGNSTRDLNPKQTLEYCRSRWPIVK